MTIDYFSIKPKYTLCGSFSFPVKVHFPLSSLLYSNSEVFYTFADYSLW